MSDCERFESTIEGYVAGEIDDTHLGPLLAHCRGCRDCRQLLELHRDLLGLARRTPEPSEGDFDAMHARVLHRSAGVSAPDPVATAPTVEAHRTWPGASLRVVAAAAAAILLFVVGLWSGRALPGGSDSRVDRDGTVVSRLVRAIGTEAHSNRALVDVENSHFTYSNVSFRPIDSERIAVDFDVTTHVQLVESARSELVEEVLVHSLLNPSTTGARLKAMSYAAASDEPKVLEALIFAMRRDDNLAVRIKALTILSDRLEQPGVEVAVLATLHEDESVQMRLLALDYLATHSVDRDRIREAIQKGERPGDEALQVRLAKYDERL